MSSVNEWLQGCFLFRGISAEALAGLLTLVTPQRQCFRRGETLCEPQRFRRAVYILTRGECDVVQASDSRVTMNTLHAGDSFGIVSLFSHQPTYPTAVVARRETEALVLPREDVEQLMQACPRIAMNLIEFLTDRVEFLNRRASSLAAPTVACKLANHLLSLRAAQENDCVALNRKRTAERLGCGRTSLYRALEQLEAKGLIAAQGDRIKLVSPEGLERIVP